MSDFSFANGDDFEKNLQAFLEELETADTEMATILKKHITKLKSTTEDNRPNIRRDFNTAVLMSLDELESKPDESVE